MIIRTTLAIGVALSLTGCFSSSDSSTDYGFCTVADQNQRVINNLRQDYLWKNELPAIIDPTNYPDPYRLLANVIPERDRFSFILTEQEYEDRYINARFIGYGFARQDNPGEDTLQVRYVYDNSPADRAGLTRGSAITRIGDRSVAEWYSLIQAGNASWQDAFGPEQIGYEVYLEWQRPDGVVEDGYLLKEEVSTNTVMAVERKQVADQEVGYFVFDSFINRAEQDVNDAIDQMIGVDELVIDLRYNGGGLIRIANQIASQTSWEHVENEVFLTYVYNENYSNNSIFFDLGQGIERLNLDRVFILTTGASCSASELIINALDPFVEVVTVGSPTCGKPVGQQPTRFCDKILFAINFQTVNAEGFGDYFDGLQPTCPAVDTVTADWGSTEDPLLAEALHFVENNQCSPTAAAPAVTLMGESPQPQLPRTNPMLDKYRHHH